MDLRKIRTDVAVVGAEAGFNAWNVIPDDPQDLPACVVGGVRSLKRLTMAGACELQIEVEFYANAADMVDATTTLDMVLSLGLQTSFLSLLEAADEQPVGSPTRPSWRSAMFIGAGPYKQIAMPGGGVALAVGVVIEFTA